MIKINDLSRHYQMGPTTVKAIDGINLEIGEGEFVSVDRNVSHSGRNVADGESELLVVDYWPADSEDRIGLD